MNLNKERLEAHEVACLLNHVEQKTVNAEVYLYGNGMIDRGSLTQKGRTYLRRVLETPINHIEPSDAELFAWLANLKCNSYTLGKNEDHTPNYQTAKQWIEDNPDEYKEPYVSDEDRQLMIETNTIWRLQVYEHTPVGFSLIFGPTMRSVIMEAIRSGVGA